MIYENFSMNLSEIRLCAANQPVFQRNSAWEKGEGMDSGTAES